MDSPPPSGWRLAAVCLATVCFATVGVLVAGCGSSRPRATSPTALGATSTTTPATTNPSQPHPSAGATTAPSSASADWLTYQHDNARVGASGAGPATAAVSQKWATPAGGDVYAQPLVFADEVIVATEADTVLALAASDGHVLWRTAIGTPVPRNGLPCGDIDPSGITSTPAIDAATGTIWVADEAANPTRHELVAVDAKTGAVRSHRVIDSPGTDPRAEQIRAAVSLLNGTVYIPMGGRFGDCGNYRGAVVGARTDGSGSLTTWQVSDPSGGGGIWTTSGATVAGGDLLVATGNSRGSGTFADGNAVVRLGPDLAKKDEFAPSDWAGLNRSDTDLNSTGPALVAGYVLQVGKGAVGYLLDANHLGGVGGQVASGHVCTAFGGTAQQGTVVFEPCTTGLAAVDVSGGKIAVRWSATGYNGGTPAVSHALVWQLDVTGGRLLGYSAGTGEKVADVSTGPVHHFAPVALGQGLVLVAGQDRVEAFG